MAELDKYLTTTEAAEEGGYKDHRSILKAIHRGNLSATRKGRGFLIKRSEFKRWLETEDHRNKQQTT